MKTNPLDKAPGTLGTMVLTAVWILGFALPLQAAQLKPETLQAWAEYVRLTEERIQGELESESGFFVHDLGLAREARTPWQPIRSGQVMVSRMKTEDHRGRSIKVPGGIIHHWRGTVFIPSVQLEDVIHRLRYPDTSMPPQEDVLDSKVLQRDQDSLRIYLKLIRKEIVTVVYNTEHLVQYRWHGASRASSRSIATRIAELDKFDTPQEREKNPGNDRGFLWRLNSYWKYQQVDGGVIVQCESLTLSRDYPFILKPIVAPIIRSVAKESMKRTLASLRIRLVVAKPGQENLRTEPGP